MLDQVNECMKQGRFDHALTLLDQLNIHQQLQGEILRSRIYEQQGKFDEALQIALNAIHRSIMTNQITEQIGARIAASYALMRLTDYTSSLLQLEVALSLLEQMPDSQYILKREYEATIYNVEGLCYRYQGKLIEALQCYNKSLAIRLKLGKKQDIAISLTNIGTLYQMQGELELALEHHIDALELFVEIGNDSLMAFALHDIAIVYWELGNPELAKEYFEKSLNIRIAQHHDFNTAQTLLELVLLNIEFEYIDNAYYYFDMLKEIYMENLNELIAPFYKLAQASLLQTSPRLIKRAKAQELYKEILEIPEVPHDLRKIAILNLCALLLTDLKLSHNLEIINEVEQLTTELMYQARSQHSSLLLVETYLLQSKLALIKQDLALAQSLLTQAEITAQEKHLYKQALIASMEQDILIDKMSKLEQLKKRNASIIERIEAVDLKKTIDDILKRHPGPRLQDLSDTPQFLLIMNENAITLYSRKFNQSIRINENLIGGFLMATNFGIAEGLHHSGTIERIKYGNSNLIFLKHRNITFCYAFEGPTYHALKRLNYFIDKIQLGMAWEVLNSKVNRPKMIKHKLDKKVDQFFLNTYS